jgi:hypothetical protein
VADRRLATEIRAYSKELRAHPQQGSDPVVSLMDRMGRGVRRRDRSTARRAAHARRDGTEPRTATRVPQRAWSSRPDVGVGRLEVVIPAIRSC